MGRGRAKAKQTKVARELKYRAFDTDFSSLAAELRGSEGHEVPPAYADLADTPVTDEDRRVTAASRHRTSPTTSRSRPGTAGLARSLALAGADQPPAGLQAAV
jgi:hypothetical protein